jgi:glycosyltransferase involved in cell wall biosynthesis
VKKLISIVTPCYNEEDNVKECYETVKTLFAAKLPAYAYEHIFCDNASTDSTLALLKEIAGGDRNVRIIANARNFGPFRSLFNGVLNARGDAIVVFLPADLQDPPEVITDFVAKWQEGYDVVYGIREKREEHLIMVLLRKLYYRMITRFAEIYIPPDVGEFQLIDRKVLDALKKFEDYYPYVRGMIASCGFSSTGIEYTWKARKRGFSKNNLYRLIDQGLNGLISFTNVPLRLCMLFGFFLAGASIAYALLQLIITLVYYSLAPPGIPTLIIALFFFSGVQLFFIGLLGEYIGAIHAQVRKRPLVIEKERINFDDGPEP